MKALVVLALLCSVAAADDYKLGDAAVFSAPAGWTAAKTPDAQDGPALVMKADHGGLLAVTVAMAPNTSAYRRREKQAYLDEVIAGFANTPGATLIRSKVGKQGTVPSIDVWLKRGKQEIAIRVLLFRTRTVGIAVRGASRDVRDAAIRALLPE